MAMAPPSKTKTKTNTKTTLPCSTNRRLPPPRQPSSRPHTILLHSQSTSSHNLPLTTSHLATTLAGIWTCIAQSPPLNSDDNLNSLISHHHPPQSKHHISSYEYLNAIKTQILFSYHQILSIHFSWDKAKYMGFHHIRAAAYHPKYLHTARMLYCSKQKFSTAIQTTQGPESAANGHHTGPMQEVVAQINSDTMFLSENDNFDQQPDNKIVMLTPASCGNNQRELLGYSSSTVTDFKEDKSIQKSYGDICDSPQQDFMRYHFSLQDQVKGAIYVNRHALAGALAGTMVTLFLHPVDTVKTIIQSRATGGYSFYHVLRQTLTERGLLGLYRGIASNIASSAPISAIYTSTYESVKGTLLPILPKEYESVTHCIAGGCSSIATSFVFTPSERIKQQMQVGTQYQNCWSALVRCIEKGGVVTLYTGWQAVLFRNIPHSIIKFYTYERLKRLSLEGRIDSSISSWETLTCGGMAGVTAALFTTPFDVVKTRIQTQTPGVATKYNGVLEALNKIIKNEGLPGLYRGLIPRLGMYVSQGSIFFASYEFLKALFALDERQSS